MKAIVPFIVFFLFIFTFFKAMIPEMPLECYAGTWVNVDPNGEISKVIITTGASKPNIKVYGKCATGDCEWGQAKGKTYYFGIGTIAHGNTDAIASEFSIASETATHSTYKLIITPAGDSYLQVRCQSTSQDNSEETNSEWVGRFKKAGP